MQNAHVTSGDVSGKQESTQNDPPNVTGGECSGSETNQQTQESCKSLTTEVPVDDGKISVSSDEQQKDTNSKNISNKEDNAEDSKKKDYEDHQTQLLSSTSTHVPGGTSMDEGRTEDQTKVTEAEVHGGDDTTMSSSDEQGIDPNSSERKEDLSDEHHRDPTAEVHGGDEQGIDPNSSERKEDLSDEHHRDPTDDEREDLTHTLPLQAGTLQQDGPRPEDLDRTWIVIISVIFVFIAVVVSYLFSGSSPPPQPRQDRSVDIFRREFEKVKSSFPSQTPELWKRGKIHLERHLQTAQPTEPVSMILTSGSRAEKTLHCLASYVAAAFSTALNSSVLHIDGASKAGLESDQVKLDIDNQLRGAFEGDKKAAIIHRFEELPPGSTLIFYRYCDHENAAYKKASLIFTVLLGGDELKSHLSLSTVEEMVQDRIQDKFRSSTQPASFDKMDVDKFSGLWSRISHLVLPVIAEKHIEQQGCQI
ncbi:hypothetical protein AGOR_G00144070 [Albula goreensis]|uniref:Torsin-1A-interacting protein 1/2 AAA+ activator domain-containing protein n=1 Tax=Albula goreensis TaxID=1534307 RepID=A0A8T3D1F2_9TELE|nr:hypothetical protein AGOR_G00144070 [Albula goreensis]